MEDRGPTGLPKGVTTEVVGKITSLVMVTTVQTHTDDYMTSLMARHTHGMVSERWLE